MMNAIKTRLKIRTVSSFIVNIFACGNETQSNVSLEYGTLSEEMLLKTGAESEAHPSKEKLLKSCDFSKSFITFRGKYIDNTDTNARIQVEARCEINDNLIEKTTNYYLVSSCKGEYVYSKGELFIKPPYDFLMIYSDKEFRILRKYANARRDNNSYGIWKEVFTNVNFHIKMVSAETLKDITKIVQVSLTNRILNGRVEIIDKLGRYHAILEFPIKTMNVSEKGCSYQVDTGPILLPDFTATNKTMIEKFQIAFVAFNSKNESQFLINAPVTVGIGIMNKTRDYSRNIKINSQNTILQLNF